MQNTKCKDKNLQFKICNLKLIIAEQHGFSFAELLIAMAIASALAAAGLALFSSSNWLYKRNVDVSGAQQNARVAMEMLAKDIRTAGFGLPDPPFSLSIGGQNWTAPITATNSSTGPDSITILGIGYEAAKLTGQVAGTPPTGENIAGKSYICVDGDSLFQTQTADRLNINVGGEVYMLLAAAPGEICGSSGKKLTLSSPGSLARSYSNDTKVYIIQAVTYSIGTTGTGCSTTYPCLKSNDLTTIRDSGNQTIAEGIEDMQFAYGIDAGSTRDGNIDDTTNNTNAGVATSADGNYTYADFLYDPSDDASIIAVRASIVSMTANQDVKGVRSFRKKCVEDRSTDASCTGARDGYRRSLLTKAIMLRNPKTGGS